MKKSVTLVVPMLVLGFGLMSQRAEAFSPLNCPVCPATTFGYGAHQIGPQVPLAIKGISDVPDHKTQRIVFEFDPGLNLANNPRPQGHMAVIGRGRYWTNGSKFHYIGTGIVIGHVGPCFGIGIENFHLAESVPNEEDPDKDDWSKVIKCKNVSFLNTLHRITVDVSTSDVQWQLERLEVEENEGAPVAAWVPVTSDRCLGGVPLPGTNSSMCAEIDLTDGKTIQNKSFSEVGVADIGLGGWGITDLWISQW